jgi:hypothetical protein
MRPEFQPAIDALQKDLSEQERKVSEIKTTINRLCELAGASPLYADVALTSQPMITTIKGDTFYGKSVITAAREYLDMRKAGNLGPASTREIFEALKSGGFIFNSKSEANSIVVVRNALSKASSIFHRLPTGEYGLAKWYDLAKIKRAKGSNDDDGESEEEEIATSETSEEESDVA